MSENKIVSLNEMGQWLLYRGIACETLKQYGLTSEILGCELWEYTDCLDMSYDETKTKDLALWPAEIEKDVQELKRDLVKQH